MKKINNRYREFTAQEWYDFKYGIRDLITIVSIIVSAVITAIYLTGPW